MNFRNLVIVVLVILFSTFLFGCKSGGGDSIVSKFSDPIETNLTLKGLITNGYDIPIKGVSVDLSNGDNTINLKTLDVTTDSVTGSKYNFIYPNIPKGNYTVNISMSGYQPTTTSLEISNKDVRLDKKIYEALSEGLATISVYCTSTTGLSVSSAVLKKYTVVTSTATGTSTVGATSNPIDAVSGSQISNNHFKFDNISPSFKDTVASGSTTLVYELFFEITVTWSDGSTTVRNGIWAPTGITTLFNIIE